MRESCIKRYWTRLNEPTIKVKGKNMKLTAENVSKVFFGCMYKEEIKDVQDIPHGSIIVEGTKSTVVFDPKNVDENRDNIADLISQVTYESSKTPLLDLHTNEDGEKWGKDENVEQLMLIGRAAGFIGYPVAEEKDEEDEL